MLRGIPYLEQVQSLNWPPHNRSPLTWEQPKLVQTALQDMLA